MQADRRRSVGSPSPRAAKQQEGETAKGIKTVFSKKAISAPETRVLTEAQYQQLLREPELDDGHKAVFILWRKIGRLVIIDQQTPGRATV